MHAHYYRLDTFLNVSEDAIAVCSVCRCMRNLDIYMRPYLVEK